jgi:hypothetical protein
MITTIGKKRKLIASPVHGTWHTSDNLVSKDKSKTEQKKGKVCQERRKCSERPKELNSKCDWARKSTYQKAT